MILRKISQFYKHQSGFTLIEMMAAMVITGFIGLGASMASGQVLNETARNSDYTTASRNAMNAIHWISRDVMMAQSMDGVEGFPQNENLSLGWVEWDNTVHSANYSLENGILRRIYSDGSQVRNIIIAEYINPDAELTNCVSDNGVLTLKITSSVGEGSKVVNITRVSQITARPSL
jgi:prepilin-type N-terminal cleavage/methylation domain-containing protein